MQDLAVKALIEQENCRQLQGLELIASENYVSPSVSEALASGFTNKYAEGYPGARYYGGQTWTDELERLAQDRALQLFKLDPTKWAVNVQPLSGSPANLAVYVALAPLGSVLMGMSLPAGGHLTHGHTASFTGKAWNFVQYGVSQLDSLLDYPAISALAKQHQPKILVSGSTAYPRQINFAQMGQIAKQVGAYHVVDMSHIAGLVATGLHASPFAHADVVTTTTHKTLRGPRAALIFSRLELSPKIDKAVFPGLQGGPHMNTIAGIAVALQEALQPRFTTYQQQVVDNLQALIIALSESKINLVTGGSDNHLALLDLRSLGITGAQLSEKLEAVGITVNKNSIPFDPAPPKITSGIRLGTPALTTRGMGVKEMEQIGQWIGQIAHNQTVPASAICALAEQFPLFGW